MLLVYGTFTKFNHPLQGASFNDLEATTAIIISVLRAAGIQFNVKLLVKLNHHTVNSIIDPQSLHHLTEWKRIGSEPSRNSVAVPPANDANLTEDQK